MEKRLNGSYKSKKFINNLKNAMVVFSYVIIIVALIGNFAFAAVDDGSGTDASQGASTTQGTSDNKQEQKESNESDDEIDNIGDEAENILNEVQGWIMRLSTFAVIIAVGSGVFIKKFSMGKQDKIELGNKLIRDSIIGFLVLNSMPIILKTIQGWTDFEGKIDEVQKDSGLQYFRNLL